MCVCVAKHFISIEHERFAGKEAGEGGGGEILFFSPVQGLCMCWRFRWFAFWGGGGEGGGIFSIFSAVADNFSAIRRASW